MHSTPRVKAGLAAGALLLTGSLIGWSAAAGGAASAAPAPGAPATATVAEGAASRTIGGAVDSYASIVEKVSPAVVTIRSERKVSRINAQGGNPFGNRLTLYLGSSNDLRLNLLVRRFSASPVALASLRAYETNGNLRIPLVTLHTTADDLIPFAHEFLYLPKVDLSERGRFIPLPVQRYGHCAFTADELLVTFALATNLP